MFLILVLHQVVRQHQQQMTKINLLLCFKRADVLSKGLCFCCGEILLRRKFGTAIDLILFFYFFYNYQANVYHATNSDGKEYAIKKCSPTDYLVCSFIFFQYTRVQLLVFPKLFYIGVQDIYKRN